MKENMEKLETERSQVKREVQKLLKPPSKPKKIPRSNRQSCRSSQILSCRSSQILSINNIRQYSFYIFLKFWIFIKLLSKSLSGDTNPIFYNELESTSFNKIPSFHFKKYIKVKPDYIKAKLKIDQQFLLNSQLVFLYPINITKVLCQPFL